MDPQTAWNDLIAAYKARSWEQVEHIAIDLLEWLLRGGFPPDTGGDRATPEAHRTAAREFCIYAYAAALSEQGYDVPVAFELDDEEQPDDAP